MPVEKKPVQISSQPCQLHKPEHKTQICLQQCRFRLQPGQWMWAYKLILRSKDHQIWVNSRETGCFQYKQDKANEQNSIFGASQNYLPESCLHKVVPVIWVHFFNKALCMPYTKRYLHLACRISTEPAICFMYTLKTGKPNTQVGQSKDNREENPWTQQSWFK